MLYFGYLDGVFCVVELWVSLLPIIPYPTSILQLKYLLISKYYPRRYRVDFRVYLRILHFGLFFKDFDKTMQNQERKIDFRHF